MNPVASHRSGEPPKTRRQELQEFKLKLHHELIDKIDVNVLVKFDNETARVEVSKVIWKLMEQNNFPLNSAEKKQIVEEVVAETFGLGPLEPLLQDRSIDDILVNNHNSVYIERGGKLYQTDVCFKDDTHLKNIISRIVSAVGRRIDEASPMVDARLADGSRVNAIIPPLSLGGPVLCIRRFRETPLVSDDLVSYGSISRDILLLLQIAVRSRMNVLVAGGTGSGKTTLLNVLSSFIPPTDRIVTIEDAAELQLRQPHVIRLETRPTNTEGKGLVTQGDLLKNALRMRPDRIVLGEVRGSEALDMLQAMNTGHDGSLTTVHSNSTRDAISRVETMVLMSSSNMLPVVVNRQIASAINLIVYVRRFPDGVRRVESVSEVIGMEADSVALQTLASYTLKSTSAEGKCIGDFEVHSVKPRFLEKARAMGALSISLNGNGPASKGAAS